MKLETIKQIENFVKTIDELRVEHGHPLYHFTKGQLDALRWIWKNSKGRLVAKDWMRVNLGWR